MSCPSGSGSLNDPPPPGTMDNQRTYRSSKDKHRGTSQRKRVKENYKKYSRSRSGTSEEYIRSNSRSYSRSSSRGRFRDYHVKRSKDKAPSRSRERRDRRTRSRSAPRRRRSHNRRNKRKSNRSRSRSYSKRHRKSYSRSKSRSRCRSRSKSRSRCRSRSHSWSSSSYSDTELSVYEYNRSRKYVPEVPKTQDYIRKVYSKQSEVPVQENSYKNDGSFLEMFKKMQEEKAAAEKKEEPEEAGMSNATKTLPAFGKRRGGRVLKTGLVEKVKNQNEVEEEPKDAWSVYMKEVKRYKEACCDDDSKTRPLVK